ncbi:MAG: lysoplasmalogenase [Parvularculaceae bacterium]
MATVTAAACALFVILLLAAEQRDSAKGRALFKPLASLSFIALALVTGVGGATMGAAILAGLVFSALGDVLLIPRREGFFLAGMGAFAIAHLCYSAGFIAGGVDFGPFALAGAAASLVFAAAILGTLWKKLGDFRIPVAAYSLIIAAMMALAVAHYLHDGAIKSARLAAAALIFAASDIFVARDQFQQRAFANRLFGLPLYYGAQLLFAANL